jgi:hypothetical protein
VNPARVINQQRCDDPLNPRRYSNTNRLITNSPPRISMDRMERVAPNELGAVEPAEKGAVEPAEKLSRH